MYYLALFAVITAQLFGNESFAQKLDQLLQNAPANVGIEVFSLTNNTRLYEKNGNRLFVPASSLKLFTAAAALSILGPDFRLETELRSDAPVEKGVLKGNLYFVGGGDPSFSVSDLEALVLKLNLEEIAEIQGDLIIDCTIFDNIAKGPGWMWDDINGFSYSTVSALTVNHSCLNLWVRPADQTEKTAHLFSYPKTQLVQLINQSKTSGETLQLKVERPLIEDKPTIHVKGSIPANANLQAYRIPIDDPHLYAGEILAMRLKQAGIVLRGKMRTGKAPENAIKLAGQRSPPVSQLIFNALKYSDNLYSDHLFKKMGEQTTHEPGTWKSGGQAVRAFLEKEVGINVNEVVMLDGSGLSRYNLFTPHHFVQLLTWMHQRSPYAPEFMAGLPIAGAEGSLAKRMPNIGNHLRAKTGYMTGIESLCGFVTTKSGEKLAFALLLNGFVSSQNQAIEELEDKICELLFSF